jgi:hypothetical protein
MEVVLVSTAAVLGVGLVSYVFYLWVRLERP